MIEWWNSLSIVSQVFACIAVPATAVLFIQTVLMLIGIGNDSDGGELFHFGEGDVSDADMDIDADVDSLADGVNGVYGDHDIISDHDVSGMDGLRVFTVRGIIAFLVVFGWVGMVLEAANAPLWATLLMSTVCGVAIMVLMAMLMRWVMKLRDNGNVDNRNAIGVAGRVYLSIPAERRGEGKINIMLQGSYVEREAVTDEKEAIPTGAEVVVTALSGQTTLVVKRK